MFQLSRVWLPLFIPPHNYIFKYQAFHLFLLLDRGSENALIMKKKDVRQGSVENPCWTYCGDNGSVIIQQ